MLKLIMIALGLSLSLVAQAAMTLNADCRSNIRSRAKSEAESTLASVRGLAVNKIARLGEIGGKVFSISLVESNEWNPFPDMVYLTVNDGLAETASASVPGEGGVALVATSVKSSLTGELVAVSCEVKINQ